MGEKRTVQTELDFLPTVDYVMQGDLSLRAFPLVYKSVQGDVVKISDFERQECLDEQWNMLNINAYIHFKTDGLIIRGVTPGHYFSTEIFQGYTMEFVKGVPTFAIGITGSKDQYINYGHYPTLTKLYQDFNIGSLYNNFLSFQDFKNFLSKLGFIGMQGINPSNVMWVNRKDIAEIVLIDPRIK